jgi:hypothetical protein
MILRGHGGSTFSEWPVIRPKRLAIQDRQTERLSDIQNGHFMFG